MDVTIKTTYIDKQGQLQERNVTLWVNRDNSISLLGNLEHNTTIIVDQKLVDDLQNIVDLTKEGVSHD